MTTPQFARTDTCKPDGFYIQFEREVLPDTFADPTDYLFQDEDYREEDQARLDAFNRGDWQMVGVRAKAICMIVRNGVGTFISLESPGLWGIEDDSGDEYFNEVFEEEKAELLSMIEAMRNPIIEA